MINTTKIRERMAELGITQRTVADKLGLAAPTVSQKLNRLRPMDLEEAKKLAEILELDSSQMSEYFFSA